MKSRSYKNQKQKITAVNSSSKSNSSSKALSKGDFVWSKLSGCKWWPAVIIDSSDCGKSPAKFGNTWVFWFGDHKISEVPKQKNFDFMSCFHDMNKIPSNKLRLKAILEVLEILAGLAEHSYGTSDDLIEWAKSGFKNLHVEAKAFKNSLPPLVTKYLSRLKIEDEDDSEESDNESFPNIFNEKLKSGELKIEEICIACYGNSSSIISKHPFFDGGLCQSCKERIKETAFAVGDDGKNICCVICAEPGLLVLCENINCPKTYCQKCLKLFLGPAEAKQITEVSPWMCFFCSSNIMNYGFLKIRSDGERNLVSLFNTASSSIDEITLPTFTTKKPIAVLSLFDGIGTGKLVLDMLGIHIDKYYSSEIDEDAINVSKFHYKDSIIHLGDVCSITEDVIESLGHIDLVIGGSPCNDLSLVNPARKGLYDFTGTGCLFFDFFHILNIVRRKNKHVFYLFENVAAMLQRDKVIISSFLMHEPVLIDAKFVSPQTRARYFWGNIPGLHSLPDFWNSSSNNSIHENLLNDYILPNMGRKAVVEKIKTVTTQRHSLIQEQCTMMPVVMNGEPDVLWVTELEKIFGFPLHYTDTGNLNIAKRRELLGRAWSVPVIKMILQPLKSFFYSE